MIQYFDPGAPTKRLKGNLPHWRQIDVMYFVTFRLADSMPQEALYDLMRQRREWLLKHPKPHDAETAWDYASLFQAKLERWLDRGAGECVLAGTEQKQTVEDTLRHFAGDRYGLDEYVVMPNHVHVLLAPKKGFSLSSILQTWKGYSAKKINDSLGRSGPLWQKESFDHIVRSPGSLRKFRQYIRDNPRKWRST
jgi:REP element-mobilizing transposase RayT